MISWLTDDHHLSRHHITVTWVNKHHFYYQRKQEEEPWRPSLLRKPHERKNWNCEAQRKTLEVAELLYAMVWLAVCRRCIAQFEPLYYFLTLSFFLFPFVPFLFHRNNFCKSGKEDGSRQRKKSQGIEFYNRPLFYNAQKHQKICKAGRMWGEEEGPYYV